MSVAFCWVKRYNEGQRDKERCMRKTNEMEALDMAISEREMRLF